MLHAQDEWEKLAPRHTLGQKSEKWAQCSRSKRVRETGNYDASVIGKPLAAHELAPPCTQ